MDAPNGGPPPRRGVPPTPVPPVPPVPYTPPPPPPVTGHVLAPAPVRRRPSLAMGAIIGASAFIAVMSLLAGIALVSYTVNGANADSGEPALRDLLHTGTFPDPPPLRTTVSDNPFYALKAPAPIECEVPDIDPASKRSWEAFSAEVGPCLDRLWEPRLADAGMPSDKPTFKVLAEPPDDWSDGPQGQGMTLAFYDSGEQTINVLMPSVTDLADTLPEADEGVWAALLAHEYGHHVQNRVGILERAYDNESEASSRKVELDSLRRTELQAECLGGVGIRGFGGFDATAARTINKLLNGGGDLESHGSSRNRQHWFLQGYKLDTMQSCNTYTAARPLVR
ncbi:putative neutral zinc metallopeptidase [Murinocardiopsis flavida]|uniref:Putative neutral zinc metallopeptidase n=1 Tax=Murinocardiopsis flavida TaxID=645275 RepID=A0A2P8DLT8_9ACTN|nr:neutral zinc metallopeptidase [Murinocardiopsis flavida]PSK98200.1 putative neutral zinc metallopeptidase [Murinocardiopsis flavida]